MASVTVNMNTCSRRAKVTATMRSDGYVDVSIESDCDNVLRYAEKLGSLTMEDLYDAANSKIMSPDIRPIVTATCLVPNAVFYAAWMETGMMSKSHCKKSHSDEIVVDDPEGRMPFQPYQKDE